MEIHMSARIKGFALVKMAIAISSAGLFAALVIPGLPHLIADASRRKAAGCRQPRHHGRGFTMVELLVVISIAATLTGIAIPSFRTMMVNANRRQASVGLYSAFNRARSEAIARNAAWGVCARDPNASGYACSSGSDWSKGWFVYACDPATTACAPVNPAVPVLVQEPIANYLSLAQTNGAGATVAGAVVFDSYGRSGAAQVFTVCSGSGTAKGREISVPRSGSVALAETGPC